MREIAVGLHRIHKTCRRLVIPYPEGRAWWELVEGVVDFHGVKEARVESKSRMCRFLLRIEVLTPMRIVPSRTADVDIAPHGQRPQLLFNFHESLPANEDTHGAGGLGDNDGNGFGHSSNTCSSQVTAA